MASLAVHTAGDVAWPLAARGDRAGTAVRVRDVEIGGREFVVVAGPCSVETRDQVDRIATRVGRAGAALFRAGAFKPRSSPYAFQGLGDEGLTILRDAARPALPVVSEALDASHLERVAEAADVVQIGARNMHNTALLRAVAGCGRPVLLKRGFAATIDELLLAAEYILAHGNPHVLLCERGIRTFERATRNTADLASVALLKRLTHLPVLVDPSHATGRADLVAPVAHAALAVGADGLLVEVHHDPAQSWSDADQAISCDAFDDLMRALAIRAPLFGRTIRTTVDAEAGALRRCRDLIDGIDEAILALLSERVKVARAAATIKRGLQLPLRTPERERDVLRRIAQAPAELTVEARLRIFRHVIDETLAAEQASETAEVPRD
jgi:3-deoxy-7-phosphoheptulonate synthase